MNDYNQTTAIIGIAVVGITTVLLIIIWEAMKAQTARYKDSQAQTRRKPLTPAQRERRELSATIELELARIEAAQRRPLIDGRAEWDGQKEAA